MKLIPGGARCSSNVTATRTGLDREASAMTRSNRKPKRKPNTWCPSCGKGLRLMNCGSLPHHTRIPLGDVCPGSGAFYVRLQS